MKRIFSIALFVIAAWSASAETRSWTNTAGGNWSIAANWSPNGVPGVLDTANITNNGTYTVTIATGTVAVLSYNVGGASGIQTLALQTAGSITAAGTVGANGILDMSSGSLLGSLVILPGGQLVFNTPGNKFLETLNLVNQGTVLWNDGQLLNGGQPATVVSNGGQWLMTGDNSFNAYSAQTNTPVWINTGLVRKSAGAGFSQINNFNVAFNPGGVVEVQNGTLRFGGGTNNTLGGSFTASTGATLDLSSGTYYDAGGVATGEGFNRFNGTTLNLRTNIIPGLLHSGGTVVLGPNFQNVGAITNLALDGATLIGSNRVSGTFVVNSGYLVNQLTILPGGQLVFNTPGNKFLETLNLVNQGTVLWNDGQLLNGGQPATVVSNGGQWLMTGDNSFNAYSAQTNTPVWINTGLLRKSAGAGFSQINNFNVAFNPGGVVDVQSGTLRFGGGSNNTLGGSFTASTGATLDLSSGTYYDAGGVATGAGFNRFNGTTLNLRTNIIPGLLHSGGTVVLGPNFQNVGAITNLALDGATLVGSNRVSGTFVVNSGYLVNQLTILPGGQLVFNTPGNKFLETLNLVNQGTVLWNDGQLLNGGQPATVVSNGGQWLMTGDNSFNAYSAQTNTPVWINTGLLRKSAGAGFSQINNFNVAFNPGGVVDVQSGTLRFGGGTNNTLGGSFTASTGATLDLGSGTYYDAGGVATGAGFNRFNGTTLNLRTNIIPGLLHSGGTVVLGPNFQNAGAITNLTLDGATLIGSNRVSGTFVVNSGYLLNQLTILPGGQLVFNTAGNKFLETLNLVNQGTVLWNDGQLLNGGQPATVVSNGGQWLMTGDNSFNAYSAQTNTPVWINTGLLRKSAGAGFSQINNFNFNTQPSGVIQADTGILRLPSNITNTAGILRVNGAQLEANGTLTMAGGTLEGSGAVGANLLAGGNIAPGTNGPGLLLFPSSLNLRSGATLTFAGTNTLPGTYDQLTVVGTVALSNATLQVLSLPSVSPGTTFIIITNDGVDAVQGEFIGLPENAVLNVSGQPFRIHYAGGSGNDVTLVRDSGSASTGPQLASGSYSNGTFRLLGAGSNAVLYTIQATTNFIHWTNLGTATGDGSGNFIFIDSNASQFRYRFYRTTN